MSLILLSCAVLTGCAGPLPPVPPAPDRAYEQIFPDAFARHVRFLADPALGGRAAGSPGNAQAAQYIADQFSMAGLRPGGADDGWFDPFAVRALSDDRPGRNVIGRLDSPLGAAPTIVIGAHYDHLATITGPDGNMLVFPGADDNASGVAALILVARALATTPERRCNFVFVAFDAEEIGFLGSFHYVDAPAEPLERTAVLINIDQVGYVRNNSLFMIGSLLNPTINLALARVHGSAKAGLRITPVPASNTQPWSDQAPFARAHLATLFFYCGRTQYYHTPMDIAERVNNIGGAQVARLIFEVARALDLEYARAPASKIGPRK